MLQIDENVQREIINHRSLRHPNIVRFKEMVENFLREYAMLGDLVKMRLAYFFNSLYLVLATAMLWYLNTIVHFMEFSNFVIWSTCI
ncbi:uncharacterized protein J3R85_005372 [Psidium guajava]|nr:uncharacterized protein J3R85_005372 [Psidium guajava]